MCCYKLGIFSIGEYRCYDFFVYPRKTKVNQNLLSKFWDLVTFSSKEEFKPLSCADMVKKSIHIFLERHGDILLQDEEDFNQLRVDTFVMNVHHLYLQHCFPGQKCQSSVSLNIGIRTIANVS